MISYELAKKLKDTGFPQDYHDCIGDSKGLCACNDERIIRDVTIPTLEELIKACGGNFHALIHTVDGGINCDKEFWSAGETSLAKDWHNGETPIEAVANLWLELNKKQ